MKECRSPSRRASACFRTYIHVAGLAAPIVGSRSEEAILADMKAASRSARVAAAIDEHPARRAQRPDTTAAAPRRGRLGFGSRRG